MLGEVFGGRGLASVDGYEEDAEADAESTSGALLQADVATGALLAMDMASDEKVESKYRFFP